MYMYMIMMMPCCSFGLGMSLLMMKEILRLSIISVDLLFSGEKRLYFISVNDVHSIVLTDDVNLWK